jgi:hypothetical protein
MTGHGRIGGREHMPKMLGIANIMNMNPRKNNFHSIFQGRPIK